LPTPSTLIFHKGCKEVQPSPHPSTSAHKSNEPATGWGMEHKGKKRRQSYSSGETMLGPMSKGQMVGRDRVDKMHIDDDRKLVIEKKNTDMR